MPKKNIKESKTTKKSEDKTKDSKQSKAKDSKKKQPNKVVKYFKDLRSEFKKVVWPSKKKVINNTSVVLGSIVIMGIFVGLLDTGLFKLLQLILSLGTAE
ncbi:MAG: preprotein translocase subunit SecE [Ruminococcus sp.]|nr:preprotein translocase subunit SecE [Ruminococcus sp.]MCD7800959.1 preprotein translocase subunit SecE [Ruminococcus sp.]